MVGNPGRYTGHVPPDKVDPENICPPGHGGDGDGLEDGPPIQKRLLSNDAYEIDQPEIYLFNIKG